MSLHDMLASKVHEQLAAGKSESQVHEMLTRMKLPATEIMSHAKQKLGEKASAALKTHDPKLAQGKPKDRAAMTKKERATADKSRALAGKALNQPKQPKVMMKGKRGGSYYVGEGGRKVYGR